LEGRPSAGEKAWKRPFKIFAALFWGVLKKLSPARRLFLLLTMLLAVLAVTGFHFLFVTQDIEFLLAFGGLLILLVLVIGDHISMKRDIEIAREIQRWLVPRRAPDVPEWILRLPRGRQKQLAAITTTRFFARLMGRC
jgi:hypothetical protein